MFKKVRIFKLVTYFYSKGTIYASTFFFSRYQVLKPVKNFIKARDDMNLNTNLSRTEIFTVLIPYSLQELIVSSLLIPHKAKNLI
jgi:hypothetical protein